MLIINYFFYNPFPPIQSSIHKGKSSVPNIILNTLSNSLSKWFSPSDQNGNLRRKRETEPDIELNDMTHGTGASTTTLEPPSKRFCTIPNRVSSTHSFSLFFSSQFVSLQFFLKSTVEIAS